VELLAKIFILADAYYFPGLLGCPPPHLGKQPWLCQKGAKFFARVQDAESYLMLVFSFL
jgi:hypothetical protein